MSADDPTLGGLLGPRPPMPTSRPDSPYPPAVALAQQAARDVLDTQCDGCVSCQQRAKLVAREYLLLCRTHP